MIEYKDRRKAEPWENWLVITAIIVLFILILVCGTGCCAQREIIRRQTDTLYVEKVQVDSIYKRDSVMVREKGDTVYIYNINEGEEKFLWHRMDYIPIRKEEIQMLADKPLAKILFQNTDVKYLEKIAKDLEPITGDTFVSYSSNRYLEFNQQGVNKGQGLLSLAEILGVDPKDTIAIGDNDNDLTMIQAAGLGCCVSNATEAVKKNSDYIAEADCDEGGVAEIIEKFVL